MERTSSGSGGFTPSWDAPQVRARDPLCSACWWGPLLEAGQCWVRWGHPDARGKDVRGPVGPLPFWLWTQEEDQGGAFLQALSHCSRGSPRAPWASCLSPVETQREATARLAL